MIIETLTPDDIATRLTHDEHAQWTYQGAYALAQYLDDLSSDTGEPWEFDVVAIRCDYTEYSSAREAASELLEWDGEDMDTELALSQEDGDDAERAALEYLGKRTTVISVTGTTRVIVQTF